MFIRGSADISLSLIILTKVFFYFRERRLEKKIILPGVFVHITVFSGAATGLLALKLTLISH